MTTTKYQFGLFEFDTEHLALSREGRPIRLQSQPAQVLAILVANAERVVSRDELKQAVWGHDTYVDFERGLNFCISQIRSALQDNATSPFYVRTVPKSGYRFMAPVKCLDEPTTFEPIPPVPHKPGRFFTRQRAIWLFAIVAALMVLALLGVLILSILKPLGHRPIRPISDGRTTQPHIRPQLDHSTLLAS